MRSNTPHTQAEWLALAKRQCIEHRESKRWEALRTRFLNKLMKSVVHIETINGKVFNKDVDNA